MRRHLFAAMGVALLVLGAIPPAWGLRANPTATQTATAGPVGVEVVAPPTPAECDGMTFDVVIVGTAGDDVITDSPSRKALIFGMGGNDHIDGGNHADCIVGGDGNDELEGGEGDDVILGGIGDDELEGGNSNDTLYGGAGTDDLNGGNGAGDKCEALDEGGTRVNCEALP